MTYQYCKSTHFVAFFTEEVENTIKRGNDSMLNISNKTILLADNDADYMKMTKEGLEKNISVKVVDMASNGEEALQKAEQKKQQRRHSACAADIFPQRFNTVYGCNHSSCAHSKKDNRKHVKKDKCAHYQTVQRALFGNIKSNSYYNKRRTNTRRQPEQQVEMLNYKINVFIQQPVCRKKKGNRTQKHDRQNVYTMF